MINESTQVHNDHCKKQIQSKSMELCGEGMKGYTTTPYKFP